ncbi:hypothetical protein PLESTB_000842800 [Pleodorina starrii]|uniref:Uncharacterized protein n=1 Tax=Pleodorina starrii TaxID=330485 RepID=A0A9W6BLU0_9CHLO|nr:hypothetical protein PLESTM_000158600 [Pleodorina starrii]GLC54278.1 hypothetical protein PLESTB_000842800 [Pleodorina starrii]GLC64421.1 hypothetical protein PLESTF_000164000 [Pleodorina starrii]
MLMSLRDFIPPKGCVRQTCVLPATTSLLPPAYARIIAARHRPIANATVSSGPNANAPTDRRDNTRKQRTGSRKKGQQRVSTRQEEDNRASNRPARPTVAALRQFEVLWLRYREELQLGKQAAASVLDDVAKGRLPCDADLLRNRARTLLLLDPLLPRLRLRQLLAAAPRTALAHEPQLLLDRAGHFAALLSSYDTTQVLMTVMPHLDRDPRVTAANLIDLDDVFGRAFGGARVPPSVFAHLLRAPGATLLPPPSPPTSPGIAGSSAAPAPAPAAPSHDGSPQASAAGSQLGGQGGCAALGEGPTEAGRGDGPGECAPGARQQQQQQAAQAVGRSMQQVASPSDGLPQAAQGTTHEQRQQQTPPPPQQQPPQRQAGGKQYSREALVLQRRHVNPVQLLRRLKELVTLFGRETAYVAVQRHPALLDRDPRDLAARVAQLLAAVDPRVGAPPAAPGMGGSAPAAARPLARLLEDAPEALDIEVGEVRRRLQELGAALGWNAQRVGQLVLQDPAVLLREPSDCRANIARLRLYALRRPATWGAELSACLGAGAAAPTAAPPPGVAVAVAGPSGRRRPGGAASQPPVAARGPTAASPLRPVAAGPGGGSRGGEGELDEELVSLVARLLTVSEELVDRFEYLVLTGERGGASVRELVYESRVKFVRQCRRYSRWWAEGAARQRGEGDGAFGLGSGLELGREPEDGEGEGEGRGVAAWYGALGARGGDDCVGETDAEEDGGERLLGLDLGMV